MSEKSRQSRFGEDPPRPAHWGGLRLVPTAFEFWQGDKFQARNPFSQARPDPLTGWSGGAETKEQIRLTFKTLEQAKAYAEKNGIDYHMIAPPVERLKIQAYADNFR